MKLFLHAGSGQKTHQHIPISFQPPEWKEIRFDADPSVSPDIVGDITDMRQIPNDHFDAIFCSHTIEHLPAHKASDALCEFLRILKPNGYAIIVCPDLETISQMIAAGKIADTIYESAEGPITPLDMLYGHRASIARGEKFMSHFTGFTIKTLLQALRDARFSSVAGIRWPKGYELWTLASKKRSPRKN